MKNEARAEKFSRNSSINDNYIMEHVNDDIVREAFFIAGHFYTEKFIDKIIEELDSFNGLQ